MPSLIESDDTYLFCKPFSSQTFMIVVKISLPVSKLTLAETIFCKIHELLTKQSLQKNHQNKNRL